MLFLTSCLHFLLSNLDCMAMVEGTDSDNLIKQMATAMSTFLASENKWVGMKDKPFPESKKPFKNTRLHKTTTCLVSFLSCKLLHSLSLRSKAWLLVILNIIVCMYVTVTSSYLEWKLCIILSSITTFWPWWFGNQLLVVDKWVLQSA